MSEEVEGGDELLARIRASEELYARAFMSNPVALSITDLETQRFTHINMAFADLVGYSRADILGRSSEELGFWPDRASRDSVAEEVNEDDTFPLVEGAVCRKDGGRVKVLASFRLLASPRPSMLTVLVPLPERMQR